MRLLHVSDVLLGNRNYRRDVREANGGHDLMDLDRRAAFDRAVGCALEHDVDVLLVAGGLIDGHGAIDEYRTWIAERLQQLHVADITPVIYDPTGRLDDLDARVLGDDHVVEVAGVQFAPLSLARERATELPNAIVVAVGHGCTPGIGGSATFDRELDDRLAASLDIDVAYVALGGMLECQALTSNAWYSGAACGLFGYHPGDQGGIIVQLGHATRRVLDLTHVSWACRSRVGVTLDAGRMNADQLANALHQQLDDVCFAVEAHAPLDANHPLAQLYGAPADPNGVGWWSRPVLDVKVRHASCELHEVFESHPLLRQMLSGGEHLLAQVTWHREGADRRIKHKFVPTRGQNER